MKVMMRRDAEGRLSAYVPKKDLEEPVVSQENPGMLGRHHHAGEWLALADAGDGGGHQTADHR